ncbi:MAG: hypothetical protein NVS1B10_02790 [Candidatus Saccharimonadales bacterium]
MILLGKSISYRDLIIVFSVFIVLPAVTTIWLAAAITISQSHILSIEKIKPRLHTIKLVVPTKLGNDKIRTTRAVSPTIPIPLTGLAKAESNQLQVIVDKFATEQSVPFGIYIKDLKTNAIATHNQNTVYPAASLYKLYVADLIFHQIDLGMIIPSTKLPNSNDNVRDCLHKMITVSDNDCGIALGTMVQWNLSNPTIIDRGYYNSNLNDPPQTTAGDTGKLLEHLYQQLGETSNNDQLIFLELLKQQQLNQGLPAGLPPATIIAHKTGDLDSYVHDVGIVYGTKTNYIISVLSGPWPDQNIAPDAFATLSQRIYQQIDH